MEVVKHFLIQFGIRRFDTDNCHLLVQGNKYFLIKKDLHDIIKKTKKPFYAGTYVGKARGRKFFPSVNLLNSIKNKTQNKIWLDNKTEWLFVCGRDIFGEGITKASHAVHKGIITLVLNERNEVLGFGKAVKKPKEKGVVVDNIFDIGDFLRRERKIKK